MFACENDDWIVDSYGMRSRLLPGRFDIPAERLTEMQTFPAGQLLFWPAHMADEAWVNLGSFVEAYRHALLAEACRQSCMAPNAAPAKFIASGLLTAFRAGVSNRELLLRLVSNPSNYSCEAADRPQGTLTEVELDLVAVGHEVFRPSRHGIDAHLPSTMILPAMGAGTALS